jgi:hypothetical protein
MLCLKIEHSVVYSLVFFVLGFGQSLQVSRANRTVLDATSLAISVRESGESLEPSASCESGGYPCSQAW